MYFLSIWLTEIPETTRSVGKHLPAWLVYQDKYLKHAQYLCSIKHFPIKSITNNDEDENIWKSLRYMKVLNKVINKTQKNLQ